MSQAHILKVSRLETLTDGIFAIGMTILVLDLKLSHNISAVELGDVLQNEIAFKIFIYAGSFFILGAQWIISNFLLGFLHRVNRGYLWLWILHLMTICIVPFSASLMADFPHSMLSISFYAVNLICVSLGQVLIFELGHRFNLYEKTLYTPSIRNNALFRICISPFFYLLSLVVMRWNIIIAFILLIAPPLIQLTPSKADKADSEK